MRTEHVTVLRSFLLASMLATGACAPPGATLPTEGTLRAREGSTTASGAFAVLDPGIAQAPGFAGGGRVSHQAQRNVAVAGEAAVGGSVGNGMSNGGVLGAGGRVSVRVSPDSDHVAVTGGLSGGWLNERLGFVGADVGARIGWNYQRVVELFAGQSVGVSGVLGVDPAASRFVSPVFVSFVTDAGVVVHPTERVSVGAAVSMNVLVNGGGGVVANRPFFVPGLFAGYTFGGR